MWGIIKRRKELLRDQERVRELIVMRAKDRRGLTEQDFVNAGSLLNVRPELLHAFYATESSNSGFDSNGRLKILYEPHVVSRNTGRRLDGRKFPWKWRGNDIEVQLSYRKWKPLSKAKRYEWHPYKEDETGRWEMLATTYELEEGALAGASYGGFQILGENAVSLGYSDTLDMIEHMYEGEAAHLEAAIRFLRRNNGIQALRDGDSRTIERIWNGKYAGGRFAAKFDNHAEKLRRAYV
ncbi:MAG: N-acetylmuramidase domain-containing protein [Pseudomonadota bacterium]